MTRLVITHPEGTETVFRDIREYDVREAALVVMEDLTAYGQKRTTIIPWSLIRVVVIE